MPPDPLLRRIAPAVPLTALAGLSFAAAFRLQDIWWPVLVAALAGPAAFVVRSGRELWRSRAPSRDQNEWQAGVEGVAAVAIVGLGAVVALRASPVALLEGLRDQRRILQVALPAPADAELLAVPYLYTVTAAYFGAAAHVRSTARLLSALPSLALLVVGLAFGGFDGLARATWVPFAWAAVAIITCSGHEMWRSSATSRDQNGRGVEGRGWTRAVGGVVMVGVVALVAVPVSAIVPSRGDDGRVRLPRSTDLRPQQGQGNPLARVTALQKGQDELLFTADASERVEYWRVAVLDRYDGESWENDRAYRVAGRHLPDVPDQPPAEPGSVRDVDATVELEAELDDTSGDAPWGRWLPVADRVTELAVDGVLFDAAGGTALVDAGRPMPDRYDLAAEAREPADDVMVDDQAAGDAEARAALRVPDDIPENLAQLARSIRESNEDDYARARAVQDALMDGDRFRLVVDDPPGGHALGHLERFLEAGLDGDADPAVGSVEQFAATYAVLARLVGLPSRVVVGFRGAFEAGHHEVRAHDAHAWVEVKFAQVGWVTFDPAPDPSVFEDEPAEPEVPVDQEQGPVATLPPVDDAANADRDGDDGGAVAGGVRTARRWLLRAMVVLVLVGLPVVAAAPGVVRWRRRARRRSAPSPGARVAGAWQSAVDELRLAGVDVTDTVAVSDLVARGRSQLGALAEPLVPLGALANHSRFAATTVDEPAAHQAWTLSDAFVTARRHGRPVRQRLREYAGRPAPEPAPSPATPVAAAVARELRGVDRVPR